MLELGFTFFNIKLDPQVILNTKTKLKVKYLTTSKIKQIPQLGGSPPIRFRPYSLHFAIWLARAKTRKRGCWLCCHGRGFSTCQRYKDDPRSIYKLRKSALGNSMHIIIWRGHMVDLLTWEMLENLMLVNLMKKFGWRCLLWYEIDSCYFLGHWFIRVP